MYSIISQTTGETLSITGEPFYIAYDLDADVYYVASQESAQGVAVESVPYHLFGRNEMRGTEETVLINSIDMGSVIMEQNILIETLRKEIEENMRQK